MSAGVTTGQTGADPTEVPTRSGPDDADDNAPIITTIRYEKPEPDEDYSDLIDLRHGVSFAGTTKSTTRYNPVEDVERAKIQFVSPKTAPRP